MKNALFGAFFFWFVFVDKSLAKFGGFGILDSTNGFGLARFGGKRNDFGLAHFGGKNENAVRINF